MAHDTSNGEREAEHLELHIGTIRREREDTTTPWPALGMTDTAGVALSILAALACAALCVWFSPSFFMVDDLQNEYVPKFYDIGQQLRRGIFPIWTDRNWFGGNYLAEYQYGLFNPLCLAVSIAVSYTTSLHAASYILAGVYMSLAACGCYALARQFTLTPATSVLVSLFAVSDPFLLYFYAGTWQPGMTGFAWFTVAAAGLLTLARQATPWRFVLAVAASYMLFTAGWPQAVVALAVFGALVVSATAHRAGARAAWPVALACVATLLLAAPAYLELVMAQEVSQRATSIANGQGILTWDLRPALLFFFPGFHDHVTWFGGNPRQLPTPLGYATIVGLAILCFVRVDFRALVRDPRWALAAAACLFYLVLAQGPSSLGPMRWPFRFIPYFHLFLLIAIFLLAEAGKLAFTGSRWRTYTRLVALALVLSVLVAEHMRMPWLLWQLLFVGLVFGAPFALRLYGTAKHKAWGFASVVLLGLATHAAIHAYAPTLATGFLPGRTLPDVWSELTVPDDIRSSYVLTLGTDFDTPKRTVADLHSAHGLLYGLKTINGYSATGHAAFHEVFGYASPHGFFLPLSTLQEMIETDPESGKTFATLAGIGHIFVPKLFMKEHMLRRVADAQFDIAPFGPRNLMLVNRSAQTGNGTLTHISDAGARVRLVSSSRQYEDFEVVTQEHPVELVFARLYWPGYRALLNGEPLMVGARQGILVTVRLPAHARGMLRVEYAPASWPAAFFIAAAGALCLVAGATALVRQKRPDGSRRTTPSR